MDKSHLDRLPSELRNYIYELVLVHSMPLRLEHSTSVQTGPRRHRRLSYLLALPHTCSKIYEESINIFFGQNRFELEADAVRQIPTLASQFMGTIDKRGAEHISRLVFKCDGFQRCLQIAAMGQALTDLQVVSTQLSTLRWASTCAFLVDVTLIFECACLHNQIQPISIDFKDLSASFEHVIADLEAFAAIYWDQRPPPGCLIGRVQDVLNVFIRMNEHLARKIKHGDVWNTALVWW
ncbi:hypothetical protein EJ03DRAFT_11681 [Teratosphaeria nubilosa]|uniref:Uncharacterized protein n=1 Tax=Teratosphaeria nubilosa TaxID=161662 RepID=A0A6G1LH91_9PEZI|nr:hypothetical protein EJ03DRAFT_11681 [Teratosphaeria nubilosa]